MLELSVENGTLVIPGTGLVRAALGIADGRIAVLCHEELLPEAQRRIDAAGLYVLPGVFDPHVHLGPPQTFAQQCYHESRSALVGGVTTLGVHLRSGESYRSVFPEMLRTYEEQASTDAVFHLQISTRQQLLEIPQYAGELGVRSFKAYMWTLPGNLPPVDDDLMVAIFRAVGTLGSQAVIAVHAENPDLVDAGEERVRAEHPHGTLADWSESHPDLSEEEAVVRMGVFAAHTPARVYIVHVGSGAALGRLREIRHRQPNVLVETTSTYLCISKYDPVGLLAKMVPPVRAPEDLVALWTGIADGVVDTIGTDNVTRTLADKQVERGLAQAGTGYPALATHLPAVLTEGVCKRGLPLEQVVDKLTRRPAQIFGLYPRKGTIAVGSDADLAIVDLTQERPADPARLYSLSDFSLYADKLLRGWPVYTIRRGAVAYEDCQVTIPPGFGRRLRPVFPQHE